jgi:hypothetical protein
MDEGENEDLDHDANEFGFEPFDADDYIVVAS